MALPTIFMLLHFTGESDALKGESTVAGFMDQIIVDSIDWDASASHDVSSGAANTGWQGNKVTLAKPFDISSPGIYERTKSRKEFKTATITVVDMTLANDDPMPMMQLTLNLGHVEDVSTRAAETGNAMQLSETLSLSFTRGELRYFPLGAGQGRPVAIPFSIPSAASRT